MESKINSLSEFITSTEKRVFKNELPPDETKIDVKKFNAITNARHLNLKKLLRGHFAFEGSQPQVTPINSS